MIAGSIRPGSARGDAVGNSTDRHRVRPGDILVLVRQRGPLFEAIIRALKDAAIPVAGADRLILTEHIAVMDLLVLADALLLRAGRSCACDDAQEPAVRHVRAGFVSHSPGSASRARLRAALRERKPDLARSARGARRRARAVRPRSGSTQRCSVPSSGRRQFLARLGAEANDALDEFLNLALEYERHETPSLQGFVAWMRTASADVKRDMEIARDEVRVMTVHGAKGLEAPIVILADTTTPPAGPPQYQPNCSR